MKLTGIAATTNEMLGDERHMRFTVEEIALMATQAVGCPVFVDFDRTPPPVGMVVGADVEDGTKLRVVIEMAAAHPKLRAPLWPPSSKLYAVPGVTGSGEPPVFAVQKVTEFGITHKPADTSTDLTPLVLEKP